jgi:hypothetical protein
MRSKFGRNVRTKTDKQLYRRHNAYLRYQKIALDSDLNEWVKAQQELTLMREEFERRGYDLNKLFNEETNAKWEGRPMDFSRGLMKE